MIAQNENLKFAKDAHLRHNFNYVEIIVGFDIAKRKQESVLNNQYRYEFVFVKKNWISLKPRP